MRSLAARCARCRQSKAARDDRQGVACADSAGSDSSEMAPHPCLPLARLRERGTGGEGRSARIGSRAILAAIVTLLLVACGPSGRLIEQASLSAATLTPSSSGGVELAYTLGAPARVTLTLAQPNGQRTDLFADEARTKIDRLFIEAQPGHVQHAAGRPEVDSAERDALRAAHLRSEFAGFTPPNFTLNGNN